MFIRKEFNLQTITGKSFIFLRKENEVDMTRILSFNKTSVWLWKQLEGRVFTEDEAFQLLCDRYTGEPEQMRQNLQWWFRSLLEEGIIEM